MRISNATWRKYQKAHSLLQFKAKKDLEQYFNALPWDDDEAESLRLLVNRAILLVERYGAADGELSAQFYDEIMSMQGANVKPAEIAEVNYSFVSQDVRQAVDRSTSRATAMQLSSSAVSGHVKRVGVETMRTNARRDKAMWAWVCIGDSCAFCRTLGSNGWQPASKSIKAGNHAEHIHDNCDCQFVVKPAGASLEIEGYDPEKLEREYLDASDGSSKDKINAMRRKSYTPEYAEQRNARRRELYAIAKAEQEQ